MGAGLSVGDSDRCEAFGREQIRKVFRVVKIRVHGDVVPVRPVDQPLTSAGLEGQKHEPAGDKYSSEFPHRSGALVRRKVDDRVPRESATERALLERQRTQVCNCERCSRMGASCLPDHLGRKVDAMNRRDSACSKMAEHAASSAAGVQDRCIRLGQKIEEMVEHSDVERRFIRGVGQ